MSNPDIDDLTRALRHHAEHLPGGDGAPLAFDDVRGKATSIRRRRQVAGGLGVAAALAVIVPTAMFATQGTRADDDRIATNTPTTIVDTNTVAPTVTPTMGVDPHALDVTGLPTGKPPTVPLTEDRDISALATTQESRVTASTGGVRVEAGGRTFGPYPSSSGLARNAAGTAVAWATDAGNVMVWADGRGEPFTISTDFGNSGVRVAAVTGDGCGPDAASACRYYVSRSDLESGQQESVVMRGDGSVEPIDPERTILGVRDATETGRVLGISEYDESRPGTCSVVLDPQESGSEPLLADCDYAFAAFSPDGSYVLADATYGDGAGSGSVAVYATAGDQLAYRLATAKSQAFFNAAVWEDDTHVLLTVFQQGEWSVVRMDVDGAMEFAVPPQPGKYDRVPWHFETR